MAKLITPQRVVLTGIKPTYENAQDEGNEFVNSGRHFIHAKTTAEVTIHITSQVDCNQGVNHPVPVAITIAEAEKMIGPFPKDRFNDPAGKVQITYTPTTGAGITIAVIEVP
ncbi:hypothetical protein ES707_00326 [subsurface metagenome]